MQISGIFTSFLGLSHYSRQAVKCSLKTPLGAGILHHLSAFTCRGGAGIRRGGAGTRRGGAGTRRGGAGIRRRGYPGRRIPEPPMHIPAPRLRQIPAPGGTILEHMAAYLE